MNGFLAALARRWDVPAETRTRLPFDQGIALANLRRIALACVLELATNGLQAVMGLRLLETVGASTVAVVGIVVSRRAGRWRFPHQTAFVIGFVVVALLMKQWGTLERGRAGDLSTGYPYTVLTIAMLCIMPPRLLAILLTCLFASYAAIVLDLPLPLAVREGAIVNTAIVSAIAFVAGSLIFAARRSDHEQRSVIRSQNEQLAARNDELDQLMAITAHDLRSPLYGLRNLFDLVQRRAEQEPHLPLKAVRDGIFSLDAMIGLVTRLLRAHAAEHEPIGDMTRDDVRGHLVAAVRRIGPQAEAAGVGIGLDIPERTLCARFDGAALEQILDNLLGNAVRFSAAGGSVELVGSAIAGQTVIAVIDHGIGVAPELRATLFQKFSRGTDRRTGGKPATGMGLFISARLAERMGAELDFRDGGQSGAIFELRFTEEHS